MPHYQCTLECRQLARRWSYVWFADGSSAAAALAGQLGARLMNRFAALHVPLTILKRFTVARTASSVEPNPPREVSRKELNMAGTSTHGQAPGTLTDPDLVEVAIVLNLVSNGGPARTMAIRGVPDAKVLHSPTTGAPVILGVLQSRVDDLVDSLADLPAALVRSRISDTQTGYTWQTVKQLAAFVGSENKWTTVTTVNAHGFTAGQRIIFGGEIACEVEGLRGEFTVLQSPTTDSFVIATRYRGLGTTQPVRRVLVRRSEYQFFPIVSRLVAGGPRLSGFKEFSVRNTGSGTTKRGRRSSKSCRV